jgi:carbon monoxide dehydrogenase subunit G
MPALRFEGSAMNFNGTVIINAPREQVWQYLTDPHKVAECAPGLESVEVLIPNEKFRAVAAAGFGAVKARFTVDATWVDVDPPNRARMKIDGKAPGSGINGSSEMALSDAEGGGTLLTWSADITILGAIASLAARLMGPMTKTRTSAFFECMKKKIEAP